MSDLNWDWWFGDGPLARRVAAAMPKQWLRSKRLRRWLLSAAVIGPQYAITTDLVWADGMDRSVVVAPVSFGWAVPSSMSMIVAEDQQDVPTDRDDQDRIERLNKLLEDDEATDNDDVRRRQRLRDLLGDDGDAEKGDDNEKRKESAKSKDDEADSDEKDLFAEPFIEERLPEVAGGRFVLPALRAVSIDQKPIGNGRVPEALNAGEELTLVPLPEDAYSRSELTSSAGWPSLVRPWAAPNTFSHPLYFEDRMLERHGHERWGCLQPIASGARFFATVPMLPYLSTIQEPCDTVYSKGYYRAGSPTPRFYQRPPLERRAVIVEAAAIATGFIALP